MENLNEKQHTSHTYIEAAKRLADMRSTAWTFLLAGIAGLAALAALWAGLLPLHFTFETQCMVTIVMGLLFLFFLITGLRSAVEAKHLEEEKTGEEALVLKITSWFQEHYSADAISNGMDETDISVDQLYFIRSESIGKALAEQFPNLEEDFTDYLIEKIYQMYFPD